MPVCNAQRGCQGLLSLFSKTAWPADSNCLAGAVRGGAAVSCFTCFLARGFHTWRVFGRPWAAQRERCLCSMSSCWLELKATQVTPVQVPSVCVCATA